MSDEYLWDRTGVPDDEIVQFEQLLARYRHVEPRQGKNRRTIAVLCAIAASVALVTFVSVRRNSNVSEWSVAGKPAHAGQTVDTGIAGAKIESERTGEVLLEPNSRLEILKSGEDVSQLALRRGTLHATIWAPPSRFVVQTPSAATIDLGCSYTLSVLEDQSSFVTVEAGWVAFRHGSTESFIPAGAACRTRPGKGPGVPYWTKSQAGFREAVSKFNMSGEDDALNDILLLATKRDALTLWHLVRRTSGKDRDRVIERLTTFVPAADAVRLRSGEPAALDAAWDSLELGAAGLFRSFQERWR